jgi:dipeptidyl-peptidase-4
MQHAFAQKKELTNEDIWLNGTYNQKVISGINSMNDGEHYTSNVDNKFVVEYEYKTGNAVDTLLKSAWCNGLKIESYEFSADENLILFSTEVEMIYRHSSKANFYVWNRKSKTLKALSDKGKQMYATFSPKGNTIAFVRENNLFIKDISTEKENQITSDGKFNEIINGAVDWVYEEEFAMDNGFEWNEDGSKIAYYKFDESKVKQYEMTMFEEDLYPQPYTYKYPKAGEDNSVVNVFIYDVNTAATTKLDVGSITDQYIPRIKWTHDANKLSFQRVNRLQNTLDLMVADASNGKSSIILTETCDTYIKVYDDLYFLKNNKEFLWTSERDGYKHLYLIDFNGKVVKQLTKGKYEMMALRGLNETAGKVYYLSNENLCNRRDLFEVSLTGENKNQLNANTTYKKGTIVTDITTYTYVDASFSKSYNYFILSKSGASAPLVQEVYSANKKLLRVINDNMSLGAKLKASNFSPKNFMLFKSNSSDSLHTFIIQPTNFDPTKKYPVIMYVYGGSGRNTVVDEWGGRDFMWQNMMAQKGYIIVSFDGHGTELRGRDFRNSIYKQMGKLETEDAIAVAKQIGRLPYVDSTRIGIQGWSFGGYLSSLCITKGADVFKAAVAIAPVTNWRYYDNIYTERFLQKPQDNPKGYDDNSPIHFAHLLKGKYLLIHGTGDDNVHFQNSVEMVRALQKANKQFEFMLYPDKAHGISGGNARFNLYEKVTDFWLKNL